jgi:DNA-binding HxlR family transcriptional regulator
MSKTRYEADLEARADLFKALGHPVRLLILNLVLGKPRHGEELALILGLNPATISHHLALLAGAGLIRSQRNQYYQVYHPVGAALQRTLGDVVRPGRPGALPGVAEDAYRNKVLRTFFKRGRLVCIPAQLKKRQIVLERLAGEFEPGRDYTERDVNIVLLDFHDDVATLRRGLIEHKLMQRERGIYRRTSAALPA